MSITRKFIDACDFLDALPGGEYVATVKTKPFKTHLGPIELPRGETWGLHYVRCSKVNGFHFAGQAHTRANGLPPLVWEWKAGSWRSFVSDTGRGAYDSRGIFRDGLPNGVQYVEAGTDRPVSRIDTYNDPVHGLSEWTKVAGLQFGQGNGTPDGGAIVFDGTHKRILFPPGQVADFINVNLDGNLLAVSFIVQGGGGWICIGTIDDFKALPIWTPSAPPPPDQPPTPKDPPVANVIPDIKQRVHDFLAPRLALLDSTDATRQRSGRAVQALVTDLRRDYPQAGLLTKTGNSAVDGFASDVLLWDLGNQTAQVIDVVGNSEGDNGKPPTPAWTLEDIRPIAQWRTPPASIPSDPPVPDPGTTVPDPGTPAQPPAVDLQPLKDQIAALEARISAVLEQKPAPDAYAHKGDKVSVQITGSVSISDVISSRKVTWNGEGVIQ